LLVSLVSFAAITLCVASQRVIPKVSLYFVMTQSGNLWIYLRTVLRDMRTTSVSRFVKWSLSWVRCTQSTPPHPISLIHSNIFPSVPRSFDWSLLFRLSNKNIVRIYRLSHARYMARSFHPLRLDHPNKIWWNVQVMKLLIMQSSPASHNFLLGQNIILTTSFSAALNLCSFLNVTDQVSHPPKKKVKLRFCVF
jgi:hypothetical protein